MATISSKRCAACQVPVLASDRGSLYTIGQTTLRKVLPNGDAVFTCGECGADIVWQRTEDQGVLR